MTITAADYKKLSVSERIELVADIWDSIASDADAELVLSMEERAELDKRMAKYHANPETAGSWGDVRAELNKRYS